MSGARRRRLGAGVAATSCCVALVVIVACGGVPGPDAPAARSGVGGPPVGLDAVRRLVFPPLEFDPPEAERFELSNGATVFFLRDATLPLVDVFVTLRGGFAHFGREDYAAASGLLSLMRNGGTRTLSVDSLNAFIDFHALGLRTTSDGGHMVLAVSGLRRQLDEVAELWREILLRPRFDTAAVERWRLRELEAVRRRTDFPGSLAVQEFNRVMYGDHSTGWVMNAEDLAPARVSPARLRRLHERIVCPENAVIGASGDAHRDTLRAALEAALAGWRPCGASLARPPGLTVASEPRVYVIPHTFPQSTVVVGQPGGVRLAESSEYFASRVADWVLGGGGFSSRLMTRVRTEEGLAYSAASVWGVARDHERILGAITHTRAERTVDAARLLIATLAGSRTDPPTAAEVGLAQDAIVNGFVFGFDSPGQVVFRQVNYLAQGLPADWLVRYLDGIAAVDSAAVADVLRTHVRPDAFTVLMVGDTTQFDPSALGDVTVLEVR